MAPTRRAWKGETVKEAQPLGCWSRCPSGLSRGLSRPGSGCRPHSPAPWPQLLLSQTLTLPPAPGAEGPLSLLTEMQRPGEAWSDLGDSQTGEPGRVEEKEMEMSKVPGGGGPAGRNWAPETVGLVHPPWDCVPLSVFRGLEGRRRVMGTGNSTWTRGATGW